MVKVKNFVQKINQIACCYIFFTSFEDKFLWRGLRSYDSYTLPLLEEKEKGRTAGGRLLKAAAAL